jgi:hypothetical protein
MSTAISNWGSFPRKMFENREFHRESHGFSHSICDTNSHPGSIPTMYGFFGAHQHYSGTPKKKNFFSSTLLNVFLIQFEQSPKSEILYHFDQVFAHCDL